ncbi:hypothetical protein [Ferruginivarius sediminum]|uniref:Uncharacterized protein n=1 Tax=Ferruginivarius sediminum TaxID=2661937 RepID=A0A369T5F9_9PROT|nr:hypothetical protein [Ferruginivarius sediminum]RDD60488.1 hypothetical protein DRB17_17980 [Ferruginivarius sediminum]
MAKLTGTEPVRWDPEDDSGKAYLIQPPTVQSWPRYKRAIKAEGARYYSDRDLLEVLARGVAAILPDEADADRVYAETLLDKRRQEIAGEGELSEAERAKLAELDSIVRRHIPAYAEAEADTEFAMDVMQIEAVRHFVVGWEGYGEDLARGPMGVGDRDIARIPEAHRLGIMAKAHELSHLNGAEAKNSASPSSGRCAPTTSTAAKTRTKPGHSAPLADASPGRRSSSTKARGKSSRKPSTAS